MTSSTIKHHSDAVQTIFRTADAQGRELTADERLRAQKHIDQAQRASVARNLDASLGYSRGADPHATTASNTRPGDVFVASTAYKAIQENRGSTWTTGPIEVQTKATLLEGDLTPGTGGPLVPVDTRPGVVPVLFQQPTVASLIPQVQTSSNKVRTIIETVATNAAAGVAEGGEKPEATLEFEEQDLAIKKVAVFLPVSDELLSDSDGIQAYLNSRLSLFVQTEEDDQLLNATGSGSDIVGILDQVPSENQDIASDAEATNAADHIYAAIAKVGESYLMADSIVIHPDDWADLRVLKDQNEAYLAGSPFSNGQPQPGESLWGKRVVVTRAIAAGTALVGAFNTAATIYRRGGLTVEASSSHADFFQHDKTALRAETRLGLAITRPAAFSTALLNAS